MTKSNCISINLCCKIPPTKKVQLKTAGKNVIHPASPGKEHTIKTCGIIAEYNPYHNGHQRLTEYAKSELGADRIIVVMSGDHVQRGEPAVMDKYARTEAALNSGADLVLELTVPFATGSAQYFARGAVSALLNTGACDMLLFGSETGDLDTLRHQAGSATDLAELTANPPLPNDILGLEYLKALNYFKTGSIVPYTLKRDGAGHDAPSPLGDSASASYLRSVMRKDDEYDTYTSLSAYMPQSAFDVCEKYFAIHRPVSPSDYSECLFYTLMMQKEKGYSDYFDVYDNLSDRIYNSLQDYDSFPGFITRLKSKEITYSHLSRALLHILLDIKKVEVSTLIEKYSYCPYLRPLGFRKDAGDLLKSIKNNCDRPFISKLADAAGILDADNLHALKKDILASEIYAKNSLRSGTPISEYRRPLITV